MNRFLCHLSARDFELSLGRQTRIMGIVNCTPDSFSGDGRFNLLVSSKANTAACVRMARKLIREGADILDIGGESTRPGALPISTEEEIKRVVPVITALVRNSKIPICVDTSKSEVACRALDAGASIVNNVRGNQLSSGFLKVVRDYQASVVVMHMRGNPATMQSKVRYKNVVQEVIEELKISVEKCLAIGIKKERIIIDPGIGFAKLLEHNLILINHLNKLNVFHRPILLGTSRKSFIGQVLNKEPEARLIGTAATVAVGIMQGAHIVRVHDVKTIKETVQMTDAIINEHS